MSHNPALDRAPFDRWTLRDKAAQRPATKGSEVERHVRPLLTRDSERGCSRRW